MCLRTDVLLYTLFGFKYQFIQWYIYYLFIFCTYTEKSMCRKICISKKCYKSEKHKHISGKLQKASRQLQKPVTMGIKNQFQVVRSTGIASLQAQQFLLLMPACFSDSCTLQNNDVKLMHLEGGFLSQTKMTARLVVI